MSQVPLADLVRDLGVALETELESLVGLARRSASFHASREADGIRLSLEIRTSSAPRSAPEDADGAGDLLRDELEAALRALSAVSEERAALEARLGDAERARKATNAALKRLKTRLKQMERATQEAESLDAGALQRRLTEVEAQLGRERIARAASEASLAMLEREHDALRIDLEDSRAAREISDGALAESRQLNADLQSELSEVWRLLRETRPGEPLAITLEVSEGDRRQNVERVQAKIIDARELFKRRRNRWPIAI